MTTRTLMKRTEHLEKSIEAPEPITIIHDFVQPNGDITERIVKVVYPGEGIAEHRERIKLKPPYENIHDKKDGQREQMR